MSLTDPVADFLARIRNAIRARHQKLDVPASKLKTEIARILKEEGYISNYKTQEEEGKQILRVYLKYGGTEAAIRDLARIRNAIRARHQKVDVPASKLKNEIARILKEEGYIANFKPAEEEGHKVLRVYLKYGNNNEAVITNLARVSRPGCRVYVRRTEIPRVLGGLGINILTTPKGVMTGRQARRQGLGGELLCEIW